MAPEKIKLLGVPVDRLTRRDLVDRIVAAAGKGDDALVAYANVHTINLARRDLAFRKILQEADLVVCDGYGLKWGALLDGQDIPERLATPDWIDGLLSRLAERELPLYALGGEDRVAEAFAEEAARRHPGLEFAGAHHGYFDHFGPGSRKIVEKIRRADPRVVLVGMGQPLQEKWVAARRHELGPRVYVMVGALFTWYVGAEERAPAWMSENGLEWLHRLSRHPARHFNRYVVGNPLFVGRVVGRRMARALKGRRGL